MIITHFDCESTGVSIAKDRIVSIHCIQTDTNFNILNEKSLIFNPTIPIPKEASDIHGITNEMVAGKPTFSMYAGRLFGYFNQSQILHGYNIKKFDVPLLYEEFARCNLFIPLENFSIIDSCKIFHTKEPRNLEAAYKKYCGKDLQGAHDAKNDIVASIEVLEGQMFSYGLSIDEAKKLSEPTQQTLDFDGKIDLDLCWTFGKNKGRKVLENIDYCEWVLTQDFSSYTKNIIKKILNKEIA